MNLLGDRSKKRLSNEESSNSWGDVYTMAISIEWWVVIATVGTAIGTIMAVIVAIFGISLKKSFGTKLLRVDSLVCFQQLRIRVFKVIELPEVVHIDLQVLLHPLPIRKSLPYLEWHLPLYHRIDGF